MATRQYIGARYVPKFYDFNGSPEWRSGFAYENLTIVTRNGNSYTSKKLVPSNIGEPENNPEYWVATGLYNEQVEAYRQFVAALSDRVDNINDDLSRDIADETEAREAGDSAIKEEISNIKNVNAHRVFLFIGDSYNADYQNSWGKQIVNKMRLTLNENAFVYVTAGGGFGAVGEEGNFYTLLQTIGNDMTSEQKLLVTDVVIAGGINDYSQTEEDVGNGIINCDNYVYNNFPNAKYYIVCCGWSYRDADIRASALLRYYWYQMYNKRAAILDKGYINLVNPHYMQTDMVHPTLAGNGLIATTIMDFIHGGENFYRENTALTFTIGGNRISGRITESGVHIWKTQYGGIELEKRPQTFSNTTPLILGTVSFDNNYLFEYKAEFPVTAVLRTNDNTTSQFVNIIGVMTVEKNSGEQTWTAKLYNRSMINRSFTIADVYAVYLTFDCVIPLDAT